MLLKKWLNGHLTQVVTTALGIVLAMAAGGTWAMTYQFVQWQERMEGKHNSYEQRLSNHGQRIERLQRRIRWLERNREARLTIWGER